MPGSTTPRGVPHSDGADKGYTIDDTMEALAEWVDGDTRVGNTAGRGSASKIGEKYVNSTVGDLSISPTGSGTGWLHFASAARVECAAGSNADGLGGSYMTWGALTQSVSGRFTRETHGGTANAKLQCTDAGLYVGLLEVVYNPTADGGRVLVDRIGSSSYSVGSYALPFDGAIERTVCVPFFANVEAGGGFTVQPYDGAGPVRINHALILRIGPA